MADRTYERRLGMFCDDPAEIERCRDIGAPYYEAGDRHWATKGGVPVVFPDEWAGHDNDRLAQIPDGVPVVSIEDGKRVTTVSRTFHVDAEGVREVA